MPDDFITHNKHGVSVRGSRVIIQDPPDGIISYDDALNLAAWIVKLVGDEERFLKILWAVKNS